MAYVDSEMAKLHPTSGDSQAMTAEARHEQEATERRTEQLQKQPATLGKLQEIDLGADARARNIARTQAALGGSGEVEEQHGRNVKSGKDGKPRRGRKRRTSEDIKRDKMVEDILHESRRNYPRLIHPNSCKY